MTLSRWMLGLALILSIALPPLDAGAMFRNEAGREASSNNDDDDGSEAPPPPPDDDVSDDAAREVEPADAAISATIQRGLVQANGERRRRAIAASVALLMLDADEEDRPALAAALRRSTEFSTLLDEDDLEEVTEAVEAASSSSAATASASSAASSTSSTAMAASAAAAPARASLPRRGNATNLARAARDPLSRSLPPPSGRQRTPTRLGSPDLGDVEGRQSHAELARLIKKNTGLFARSDQSRRLESVGDALKAASKLLPALREAPIGQMPPGLADTLVSLADRGGKAAADTQRDPNTYVRSLASPATGIDAARLQAEDRAAPIERVGALDRLIATAQAAAQDHAPGTPLRDTLEAVARDAMDDRTRLVAYLNDTAQTYPRAFATIRLPAGQLGDPVSGGLNSAPRPVRFDFATGTVRYNGLATALFKPTSLELRADGGLSSTGVDLSPEVPYRLEQRSIATRRMAELLGIGELVVNMQIAYLDDSAGTLGLLMERAAGEPGIVERTGVPNPSALAAYDSVQDRLAEVKAMIAFLDSPPGSTRPPTPLVTAEVPASGAWDRSDWLQHDYRLNDSLLDIPIRNASRTGPPNLVGVFQERPVTDDQLKNPDLRRQLSNAQWLDLLCGQVDRHMGNLFLDTSGRAPVVTLIDNDLSFGIKNDVYGLDSATAVPDFRLPPKPKTVDAAFKKAFTSLNENQLRAATKGLLTDDETNALVERFDMLKKYMKSPEVREVQQPGTSARKGALRWDSDPALLFIGHDNRNRSPVRGDPYSYFGLLSALPARPAPGGN